MRFWWLRNRKLEKRAWELYLTSRDSCHLFSNFLLEIQIDSFLDMRKNRYNFWSFIFDYIFEIFYDYFYGWFQKLCLIILIFVNHWSKYLKKKIKTFFLAKNVKISKIFVEIFCSLFCSIWYTWKSLNDAKFHFWQIPTSLRQLRSF